MAKLTREDALLYHSQGRPGKIEVIPTKPYSSQRDLSLAYSPGVAEPCLEIEERLRAELVISKTRTDLLDVESSVRSIVDMTAIAVLDAIVDEQIRKGKKTL